MISEKLVRSWIYEQRKSYADLAMEYRERNMNGESYREFNEMAAAGCDSAVSTLSLLLESFDQRLALGKFDAEEVSYDGERIKLPCNVICDALLFDMHYWEERAEHFAEQLAELPAEDPGRATIERQFDCAEYTIDIISACMHTVQRVYKDEALVLSVLNKLEKEGVLCK